MTKKYTVKKRKKIKTWLQKVMYRVLLPCCAAVVAVFCLALVVIAETDISDTAADIIFFVDFGLLIASCLIIIFLIIPKCRARQAMLDFENYDFSPHTAKDTEIFSHEMQTQKYCYSPSPFDDDEGVVEISGGKAADDYFSQFDPERLKIYEELLPGGEFVPLSVSDFGTDYFQGTVEKRREGEYVTVTVTEKPEIIFDSEGAHLGEKTFAYEEVEATVLAEFIQPYAHASARVLMLLSDDYAVLFAFGTRIMSVIDKHGINVTNRETADYILSDPKRAFRQIGLHRKLKKLH